MIDSIFVDISIVIILVSIISMIMRAIKQPLIIGYILTGIIVSTLLSNSIKSTETFSSLSHIGVAFLLFIVGMQLNLGVARNLGKTALILGFSQVFLTFIGGFILSYLLGFSFLQSVVIGVALTFSSTIIVLKILSDKRELDSVYGKLSVAILLIQDLIVFFILLLLPTFQQSQDIMSILSITSIKAIFFLILIFLLAYYVFPRIGSFISKSSELLFVFSLGWCFAVAALFAWQDFTIEIGALLAGVALSVSPYRHEIISRIRPLRDFFLVVFFVLLGITMNLKSIPNLIIPIIVFSLFVLIFKPLIVMFLMAVTGHRKRNNFFTAISLSQISEFSFIFVSLLAALGYLQDENLVSLVTAVGFITIAGSTYFMNFSEQLYRFLFKAISLFERKSVTDFDSSIEKTIHKEYDAILFGSNRVGHNIIGSLKKNRKKYLVVDFNPDIIKNLSNEKVDCIYGDADDIELINEFDFRKVKMVISTIPNINTNLLLVNLVRKINSNSIIIVVSQSLDDALKLYKEGATYVLMPHFIGGYHLGSMIKNLGVNYKKFSDYGTKHIADLKEIKKNGKYNEKV